MQNQQYPVWICLCHPSDIRNIGGAIRAVANFGLAGIKVVCDESLELSAEDLSIFSSGAYQKISFRRYGTLVEATETADILIGTSRRPRDHSHLNQYPSSGLSTLLGHSKEAHILFGNERVGLSHDELDLCHALIEIHSTSHFPSLNLAHAVACVGYELARPKDASLTIKSDMLYIRPQTSSVEDDAFLKRVQEVCEFSGFPSGKSADTFAKQLRGLIRKANPTPGDYGLILGVFRELERLSALEHATK